MKGNAAGGAKTKSAGPLIKDASATAQNNLNVLKRTDPDVEEVLETAGHVCLYGFDVDTKQWVRARAAATARSYPPLVTSRHGWRIADAPRSRPRVAAEPQGGRGLHVCRQAVRLPTPARNLGASPFTASLTPAPGHARRRTTPRFQFIIMNRLNMGAPSRLPGPRGAAAQPAA